MNAPNARLVKLCELWQRKSAKTGKTYFSGFMGDVQVLMFRGGEITRPNGEVVQTWRLFVQERDPERRPQSRDREACAEERRRTQPRGDAAYDAAYDPSPWLERQQRADPGQHDTPTGPDDEIPF